MIRIHASVSKEIEVTKEQAQRLIAKLKGKDVDISDIEKAFYESDCSGTYEGTSYIPLDWLEYDLDKAGIELDSCDCTRDGLEF